MICPCGTQIGLTALHYPYCSKDCRAHYHHEWERMGGFYAGYLAGVSAALQVVRRVRRGSEEMPAFRATMDVSEGVTDLMGMYEQAWGEHCVKRQEEYLASRRPA